MATWQSELLILHNLARKAAGVAPLKVSVSAGRAAQANAKENASRGRLKHQALGPLMTGSVRAVAENIAYGQQTPAEVMECWMNSRGHRANILNPRYNSVGFGMAQGRKSVFWCVVFMGQ